MRFLILLLFLMVFFAFVDILIRSFVKILFKGKNRNIRSKNIIKDAEYEIIDEDD